MGHSQITSAGLKNLAKSTRALNNSMLQTLRSRGFRYTLGGKINAVVPAKVFRFRVFRVFRLHALDVDPSPSDATPLTYRWCETDDDISLAERLTFFRSAADDRNIRFRACLANQGDDVVGGVWQGIQFFDEDELGIRIRLKSNQAWIFAAYVSKSHRGQRIYPRLLNHVLTGDDHLVHYASINTTNRASIAAHAHFAQSQTGRCIVIRLFAMTFCWTGSGLKASRHVAFNSQHHPIDIDFDC